MNEYTFNEMVFAGARKLQVHLAQIRVDCESGACSEEPAVRQHCLALFLLDQLGLRLGEEIQDELNDDEGIGVVTLLGQHVTLLDRGMVAFEFPCGPHSWFSGRLHLPSPFASVLAEALSGPQDRVLQQVTFQSLEKFLKLYDKNLTALGFLIYKSSSTFRDQLDAWTSEGKNYTKKNAYTVAVLHVAKICNLHLESGSSVAADMERLLRHINKKKKQTLEIITDLEKRQETTDGEWLRVNVSLVQVRMELSHLMGLGVRLEKFKTIYLRTSSFLDPRITVAWCKRWSVPIEDVTLHRMSPDWALATEADFKY